MRRLGVPGVGLGGNAACRLVQFSGTGDMPVIPTGAAKVRLPEARGGSVRAADVTNEWERFLGNGQKFGTHPRLGTPDSGRISTYVGGNEWRSIRYGKHEMTGSHYHEEVWRFDPAIHTVIISNKRVSFK